MEDKLYNFRIQPAERLSSVQEYYFSVKLKEVARMNAEGKDIISLAIGSPDMPPSPQTIETLCEEARHADAHGYQPTTGIPELRRAMADFYKRWYDVDLDPACEIQPLIGSKEGILHVTLALANPGDRILVPNPGYPTYTSLSKILGQQITYYDLLSENGWQPDFKALEEMDLTGVKIMWTNYPNMPTGANARRETYEKLVDFALRHNLVIVNDNPYSFILNHERLSILQVPGAKRCCIEFNSMSKSHNMPGWRVGMLATNAEFVKWILKVKSNIDSGTFRPLPLTGTTPNGTKRPTYMCTPNDGHWPKKSCTRWAALSTRRKWACSFGDASRKVATMWNNSRRRFCTKHGSSLRRDLSSAVTAAGISGFRFAPKKRK